MPARDERVVWTAPGAPTCQHDLAKPGSLGRRFQKGEEAMQAVDEEVGKDEKADLRRTWIGSRKRYRPAHGRARAVSSTLATLCILVASSAYLLVAAPGSARAIDLNLTASSESSCSASQLIAQQQSIGSGVNNSLAVQSALSTPNYLSSLAEIGQSTSLSFNSVFNLFSLNVTSCSAVLASVNVVFSASSTTSSENLVAVENPIAYNVTAITTQSSWAIQADNYLWGGYEMPIPSSYSPYAQWTVPILSAPSGCPPIGVPCPYGFLIWVGQSVVSGGSGWISQTGTDQRGVADCFILFCTWSASSGAWYEWFPAKGVPTFGVNSGDSIYAYSTYSGGTYAVDTIDLSNGKGFHTTMQHSSAPAYAQFTSESEQIAGINIAPPNFGSVTIQGEMQISSNSYLYDLLLLNPYPRHDAININVGNMIYQGPCGHHSCFQLTYT